MSDMPEPTGKPTLIDNEPLARYAREQRIRADERQKVGRELLDEFKTRLRLKTYVPENIVREICKLENDHE